MDRETVLQTAEFDPKVKKYWLVQSSIGLVCSVIGIPIFLIWLFVGPIYFERYLQRMGATLTDRSLKIRKGIFFRVEKTIPLDKITDLALHQGPLMRYMGLEGLKVETAGQSAGPGESLVGLVGIVELQAFRDAVLDQRDVVTGGAVSSSGAPVNETVQPAAVSDNGSAVLVEIRDTLGRVEKLLEKSGSG